MAYCDSIGFNTMSEPHSDDQKDFNQLFPFEGSFELTGPGAVSPFALSAALTGADDYCQDSLLNEATLDQVDAIASSQLIPTPPPDSNLQLSPSDHSTSSTFNNSADEYLKGSSLEESPVSSPSSSFNGDILTNSGPVFNLSPKVCKTEPRDSEEVEGEINGSLVSEQAAVGESCANVSEDEEKEASEEEGEKENGAAGEARQPQNVPKNVKLPQRKGGMQLWQFLYALLSDHNKKYNKLIEWTSNSRSREFRLLEPEAIAIWWGEHKNKKNMSYDKLSRSLRYYYDKGIIRKIPGERYVYQFCIDPELMYKHIGNSDCRPKLKPMPQAAHQATSEYQMKHGCPPVLNKDPLYIAQGPVSLAMLRAPGAFHPGLEMPFLPPGYHSLAPFQGGFLDSNFMSSGLEMSGPPSAGHVHHLDSHPMKPNLPPMRKCRSFDSANLYMAETELSSFGHPFGQGVGGMTQSLPSAIHTPPPPLHDMSPPPASSGGVSPIAPSFSSRNELLDELIELSSTDSFTTQHQSVYSSCDANSSVFTNSHDIPISWNFS